jgi:small subunit ribosomal protein S1
MLSVGQQLELKVLKIDAATRRISLGLKQLQAEPWETATERYTLGQRIRGVVTRLMDFGAFIELEPGIEGLIHVSEMSWVKKIHKPSDILKSGDTVDAVILSISPAERRISLGLKQALGDPWVDVAQKFPVGSAIEGPVTRLMKFGAFVQLTEGIEGLVHISEIVVDRRLNHPQDMLRTGQIVKAQVLAIDVEKRQIKLSIKQLIPTGLDEFLEEHKEGDIVSGRVVEQIGDTATIELGEGIRATCRIAAAAPAAVESSSASLDFSALTSMLSARWKSGAAPAESQPQPLQPGQVRSFRLTTIDREAKRIDLALA